MSREPTELPLAGVTAALQNESRAIVKRSTLVVLREWTTDEMDRLLLKVLSPDLQQQARDLPADRTGKEFYKRMRQTRTQAQSQNIAISFRFTEEKIVSAVGFKSYQKDVKKWYGRYKIAIRDSLPIPDIPLFSVRAFEGHLISDEYLKTLFHYQIQGGLGNGILTSPGWRFIIECRSILMAVIGAFKSAFRTDKFDKDGVRVINDNDIPHAILYLLLQKVDTQVGKEIDTAVQKGAISPEEYINSPKAGIASLTNQYFLPAAPKVPENTLRDNVLAGYPSMGMVLRQYDAENDKDAAHDSESENDE